MSDLLAIFGGADSDPALLAEIAAIKPRRVTVLLADAHPGWADDDSPTGDAVRDRLAGLMATIERQTSASVLGLAGDRTQLSGARFDIEISTRLPLAA